MSDDTGFIYHDGSANVGIKAEAATPTPLPESIVINGVTYRREADWIDKSVNKIKAYLEISSRTSLSLREVYFIHHGVVLPD